MRSVDNPLTDPKQVANSKASGTTLWIGQGIYKDKKKNDFFYIDYEVFDCVSPTSHKKKSYWHFPKFGKIT